MVLARETPPAKGSETVVPQGWRLQAIREFARTASGGTPKRGTAGYYDGDIPWVKSGELGDRTVHDTSEKITRLALKSSSAKLFPAGTLCIALYGATVGKLGILGVEAATNQAVCGIFLPSDVDTRFMFRFLESKRRDLIEQGKGGAQPNISQDIIRNILVPLPPLDEQQRIVAEIEKQFTRLEAGVASLKRVQAALKRYRASVLKAACEGRLVPTEAEWTVKPINVAIKSLDQGWSPKCESESTDDPNVWTVMKTTAIQPLRYLENENKRLPSPLQPRPHLELAAGDLLVTRAGPRSRAGVVCLVRTTRPRVMLCDKAYRLRCDATVASAAFLELVLNAPHVVDAIDELKTGISDSGVNLTQTKFRNLTIPIPPLAEQQRIVAEVERRLSVIEELETAASANLQRATRLRQSILHRAFCPPQSSTN